MEEDNLEKKCEVAKFDFTEPTISVYDFEETFNESLSVRYQVLKMDNSVLIWIGTPNNSKFSDLSLSMKTPYDSLPISSRILGGSGDSLSISLAGRLTNRLKKPVYVSFNMTADKFVLPDVEKRLLDEVKNNPDVF